MPRGRREGVRLGSEAARLLSEVAVSIRYSAGRVRPPAKRHAVVVDRDVGVVVLRLGKLAHSVHERECGDEVSELERPLERVVDLAPIRGDHGGSIYHRPDGMAISAESAPATTRARKHERRAGREFLLELVFRPLAGLLAPLFLRARISPLAVVLANAAVGTLAAVALVRGELLLAALLLQVKTLLDNTDGQLARISGRMTLTGRYLDTEADLVVNAALFAALGYATGQPWLALAAFLALTLMLAADFNVSELYREVRGEATQLPASLGGRVEHLLGRVYRVVFAPQDRAVRAFSARRLERVSAGEPSDDAVILAYNDRLTVKVLANFGLSTQLAVLGLCLVLDSPVAYLWLTLGSLAVLPLLQGRREHLARRAVEE